MGLFKGQGALLKKIVANPFMKRTNGRDPSRTDDFSVCFDEYMMNMMKCSYPPTTSKWFYQMKSTLQIGLVLEKCI